MQDRPGCRPWVAPCVLLLLTLDWGGIARAEDGEAKPEVVPRGAHPTEDQSRGILTRVLTHPWLLQHAAGHRLKAIRITLGIVRADSGQTRTVATVVLFDHTAGETTRVLLDTDTGEMLAHERMPGRPQGSPEEFEEAVGIVRADSALAPLLEAGGVLDGGFIVADRGGSRRRLMQLKLLSADRLSTLRTIHVDLTRGTIASVAALPIAAAFEGVP